MQFIFFIMAYICFTKYTEFFDRTTQNLKVKIQRNWLNMYGIHFVAKQRKFTVRHSYGTHCGVIHCVVIKKIFFFLKFKYYISKIYIISILINEGFFLSVYEHVYQITEYVGGVHMKSMV